MVSTTLAKLMEKFTTGVNDTGGAPSLREFSLLIQYSGAGRKLIHEKKPEAKNPMTLSLQTSAQNAESLLGRKSTVCGRILEQIKQR